MSTYRDGCPECVVTVNIPTSVRSVISGVVASYRCRCGHEWSTSWHVDRGAGRMDSHDFYSTDD